MEDVCHEVCFFVVLLCLTVYLLNALSKDKREIEITSIGMKFVCIPHVKG